MLSTSQDRIVRLSRGLLWTLDIPCLEAVEYTGAVPALQHRVLLTGAP